VIAAYTFGEVLWTMLVFFFWMMAIWIFISLFADILRRSDISGLSKAGWILLLFVLPFLGALIYIIARPKMTEQDKERIEKMQEAERRVAGYSAADEIEKLTKLRDSGAITAQEFEEMKRKALIQV